MSRPKKFKESLVVSVRFESDDYEKMKELAALETISTGKLITALDLVRDACKFVYGDNERLRESFRRSREHINKRFK